MSHLPFRAIRAAAVLLALALATGCATTLKLSSSPPDVTVYDGDNALGKTPIELNGSVIKAGIGGGYMVRLERSGYRPVYLWFPEGVRNLNLTVNLEPFRANAEGGVATNSVSFSKGEMDRMAAEFLALQARILAGGATGAEAQEITGRHPDLGTAHYLAALGALRQGNKDEAANKIRQAMVLSPQEPDYVVLGRELGVSAGNGGENAVEKTAAPAAEDGADDGG